MKLDDLRQAVRAADAAAVLVPSHVLERLIQQVSGLPAFPWWVPHRDCLLLDRQELFRHAEQDELDLEAGRLLPPKVILLARPPADRLASQEDGEVLLTYWRRLFHCAVHRELESRWSRLPLTEAALQARLARLGQAAFAEVRAVLAQDRCLLPPADDRAVYGEFAATYLELRCFSPVLLPVYFPGLPPPAEVDALLAEDVADAAALFARSRPTGAPEPTVPDEGQSDEAHDYYRRLDHAAAVAAAKGNDVRAAILHTRAARVAPPTLTPVARAEAQRDLRRLIERLREALSLDANGADAWMQDLPALLDRADQGPRPVEAALLFDLQKACTEHEREAYALDLVEWVLSAGRRPVQRPLPTLRLVRITRAVRDAAKRLTTARLADAERRHLAGLLRDALRGCEDRVRQRVGPALADAFLDAGLQATTAPEQVAFTKMVEELLDRITGQGYFSFGDLRDVISRNGLKVRDLDGPREFLAGDPLLRLDQRLAALLDGIYRRGDIYLRWLHRATALAFGTPAGRAVTRFVALPFGGAFVLTEGLDWILDKTPVGPMPKPTWWGLSVGLSLFLLALVASGPLRQRIARGLAFARRASRWLVVDLPARVWRDPRLRAVLLSWPVQLGFAYVLKPLAIWAVFALAWPILRESWPLMLLGLLTMSAAVNSRAGQAVQQAIALVPMTLYAALTAGLIPGLVRWTLQVFKTILSLAEYAAHAVDEWLRFRSGESWAGRAVRAVLGLLWFPIGWLLRFYLVVLIEPGFNPIKAPIAILAAKFFYPYAIGAGLTGLLEGVLTPILGGWAAWLIAVATVWLLPDAVAFLVWETKENWSLYRANRPTALRPVPVGSHGETVKGLLRPGFHSGTVPRLYARLRSAEGRAALDGDWRAVRANREHLHEAEAAMRKFVERELVALLGQADGWRGRLTVGAVTLSTNAIRVELRHDRHAPAPLVVAFAARAGWLVAVVEQTGWLTAVAPAETVVLANALAGLYKLAAVDLVQEQVRAGLPTGFDNFSLELDRLVLRPQAPGDEPLWYDLTRWGQRLKPEDEDGARATGPELDAERLVFRRVGLTWAEWEAAWRPRAETGGTAPLTSAGAALSLVHTAPLAPAETDGRLRINGEAAPANAVRNGAAG